MTSMHARVSFCILVGHALLACNDRQDDSDPASSRTQPLEVEVSAALDVERSPELKPAEPSGSARFVCGRVRCAVFYSMGQNVYASRVDQAGQAIDHPPIAVGNGSEVITAAAKDDDFVVIWSDGGDRRRAARLRGADGSLTDFTPNLPSTAIIDNYQLASTGNSWLLIHAFFTNPGGGIRAHVKSPDSFATIGSPVEISFPVQALIVPGQDQYLLVWSNLAQRISEATGALLDPSPIEFSRYGEVSTFAQGAYKDGVYLLSWSGLHDVYASRIRAADAARLDPDDDQNQISGAKIVASGQASAGIANAFPWRDSVLVMWNDYGASSELRAARMNVATGVRVSGATSTHELGLPSSQTLWLNADWGMAFGNNRVIAAAVQQVPPQITLGSEQHPVVFASEWRREPSVASNGDGFFVAWTVNESVGPATIVGSRISTSGQYLDDPPLVLGAGYRPTVAARGPDYLVAWANGSEIQRRFVTGGGQLESALPPLQAGNYVDVPRLAYNGQNFALAWLDRPSTLKATRLDSAGAALAAAPITLSTDTGERFSVVADTAPAEASRTFLIAYNSASGVEARLLRSASGAVITPTAPLFGGGLAGAASDGTRMFVVFTDGTKGSASFVEPADGVHASPGLESLARSEGHTISHAWFDGRSFLVGFDDLPGDSAFATLSVRRFLTPSSPLDNAIAGAGTVLEPRVIGPFADPVAAGDGSGRSLYVYVQDDPARLGYTIKARLIKNDGHPAVVSGDGGDADASGGSNGNGGMGGTGAIDAGDGAPEAGATGGSGNVDGAPEAMGGSAGSPGSGGSGGIAGSAGEAGSMAGAASGGVSATGGTAGAGTEGTAGAGASGSDGAGGSAGSAGAAGANAGSGPRDAGGGTAQTAGTAGQGPASDDGGCGCRQPARSEPSLSWVVLGGLGTALLHRRRRRSNATPTKKRVAALPVSVGRYRIRARSRIRLWSW
jgi:hypothetical protein